MKTLKVRDGTYRKLVSMREPGEELSDLLDRLLDGTLSPPLSGGMPEHMMGLAEFGPTAGRTLLGGAGPTKRRGKASSRR